MWVLENEGDALKGKASLATTALLQVLNIMQARNYGFDQGRSFSSDALIRKVRDPSMILDFS